MGSKMAISGRYAPQEDDKETGELSEMDPAEFQIETKLWRTQTCCGCVNLRVGMLSILFLWSIQTALLLYTSIGKVRWFDFVPSVIHGICVGVAMAFAVFSERYTVQKAFSAIAAFMWIGGSILCLMGAGYTLWYIMLNTLDRTELTTAICYLVIFLLYVGAQVHFAQVCLGFRARVDAKYTARSMTVQMSRVMENGNDVIIETESSRDAI